MYTHVYITSGTPPEAQTPPSLCGIYSCLLLFKCKVNRVDQHVNDTHILLHTYNDTHTQYSVKKYVYFIWRGLFFCGGATFQLEMCISFGGYHFLCFNRSRIVAVFRRRGHIVQMYPLLLKTKYNYYTTGK